jgi:hypothetical protein
MSRKKFGRRRSRYRLWYALGVTYCWSFFLNLAIFVLRIGYLDRGPEFNDPDVTVWQVPAIPIFASLVGALLYSVMWLLLALGFADVVARLSHAIRHPQASLRAFTQASGGSALTRCLIWQACCFLPVSHRARYEAEWLAELDYLRSEGVGYTRWAIGILCSAPWTGLVLRGRLWLELPFCVRLRRLGPVWVGVITALAVFSSIAASWFPRDGELPSRKQLAYATLAAVLSGGLAGIHSWKERNQQKEKALKQDPP